MAMQNYMQKLNRNDLKIIKKKDLEQNKLLLKKD